MPELQIRKDPEEGVVEVNNDGNWRGLAPDAARSMADSYDTAIESGEMDNDPGTRQFIRLLREYADDVEG